MLRRLKEKGDNMQKQMDNISKKMKILRKFQKQILKTKTLS